MKKAGASVRPRAWPSLAELAAKTKSAPPPRIDVDAMARLASRIDTELEARSIPPKPFASEARSLRPTWWMIAAPLTAALAIVVWMTRLPADAPLPTYALMLEPGGTLVRGGAFTLVARPSAPTHGAVEAHAVLVQGHRARLYNGPIDVSRDGAVRMGGAIDSAFDADGPWEIDVVVGRPGLVPTDPDALARASAEGAPLPSLQIARAAVTVTR